MNLAKEGMMKNFLLIVTVAIIGTTGYLFLSSKNTDANVKKNVLFVVVDDLNTTLGCYEHPLVKTPNIDQLAADGIKFNNAYCNYAVCGPSRSSFLTGLTPQSINILNNSKPLLNELGDRITLPYLFKLNGYDTYSVGKVFHKNDPGHLDEKAWNEVYKFHETPTGAKGETRDMSQGKLSWCYWRSAEGADEDQEDGQSAKKAVEIIKQKHDNSFFIALGLAKPHDPFIAPQKYFDMYSLEHCNPPVLPEAWVQPGKYSLPGEGKLFKQFTEQDKREFLRSYYACTSFMDAQLGKVIKALEESGQLENTLIVFFGDHGYHLGEHDWWNKVTVYEQGTRAPFIVSGKDIKEKGASTNAMIEFIDIYPTLAELCNLDYVPDYLEGKSFVSVLKNPESEFRSEVRAIVGRGKMLGKTVKTRKWRYTEWDDAQNGIELYDQQNDPMEYNNLADDENYKLTRNKMKKLLIE